MWYMVDVKGLVCQVGLFSHICLPLPECRSHYISQGVEAAPKLRQ